MKTKRQCWACSRIFSFLSGFLATMENLENEFQFPYQGKVREFEKSALNQEKSSNLVMFTCMPKKGKMVVPSVCCFFHNQMTYSLNTRLAMVAFRCGNPFLSLAWWLWCMYLTYNIYTKESTGSGTNVHCIMEFRKIHQGNNQGILFPWNGVNPFSLVVYIMGLPLWSY